MRLMSITCLGAANRSFISGIRLCPPASSLPSPPNCAASFAASVSDLGAWYSKGWGIMVTLPAGRQLSVLKLSGSGCRVPYAFRPFFLEASATPQNNGVASHFKTRCSSRTLLIGLLHHPPDFLRLEGHIDVPHAEGAQRVNHRIHHGGR